MSPEAEPARLAAAYARRTDAGLYAWHRPEVVQGLEALRRILIAELAAAGFCELAGRRILDVGCGTGLFLLWMLEWGAQADHLAGVDLLPARLEAARARLPSTVDLRQADARFLPHPEGTFDLVWAGTVFSSVLDDDCRRSLAADLRRVLAPTGLLVLYDFRYPNPRNPDVRALTAGQVRALFPGCRCRIRTLTLLPPLARRLTARCPGLAALLATVPLLRSHALHLLRC